MIDLLAGGVPGELLTDAELLLIEEPEIRTITGLKLGTETKYTHTPDI